MKRTLTLMALAGILLFAAGCEDDPAGTNMGAWDVPATLEFTKTSENVAKGEGIAVFDMESSQVVFTIDSDRDWCTAYVADNNKLVVKFGENQFKVTRTATLTVRAGVYIKGVREGNVSAPKSVTVTQAPGDLDMPQIGEVFDNGLVFWRQEVPYNSFKVVSLKRIGASEGRWSSEQVVTNAIHLDNGLMNADSIARKDLSKYPAFSYCDKMAKTNGLRWYLPAQNEFVEVMKLYNGGSLPSGTGKPETLTPAERAARKAFEEKLAANSGDKFNDRADNDNGESYWTSTESSDKNGIYVRVGAYDVAGGAKTGTARFARCTKLYDLR